MWMCPNFMCTKFGTCPLIPDLNALCAEAEEGEVDDDGPCFGFPQNSSEEEAEEKNENGKHSRGEEKLLSFSDAPKIIFSPKSQTKGYFCSGPIIDAWSKWQS